MKTLALPLALAVFVIGCNKAEEPAGGGDAPKSGGDTASNSSPAYSEVQAIFDQNCIKCHGENGKDGVDLRSYDSLMKGGEHGPIVVAGKPEDSKLVHAVRGLHGVDRMPKMANPLAENVIVKIENWIKAGAKS